MMPDRTSVLYFEDTDAHAQDFFAAMKARAEREQRQYRLVWFKVGLKAPRTADFKLNRPYPATVRGVDKPLIVDIDGSGLKRANGKVEWWPHEFDAAVLDVVHQASQGTVGHDFAKWLSQARFSGPVFMLSIQAIATTDWGLRNFHTLIKRDDQPWIKDLANAPQWAETANGDTRVNYRGWPPQRLMSSFFDQSDLGAPPKTIAYFGESPEVGVHLAEFLSVRRLLMGDPGVHQLHETLKQLDKRGSTIPSVIAIDCGPAGSFNDELLRLIELTDDAVSASPVWLVLADRQEVTDRATLASVNVAMVDRHDIIHRPSVWAHNAMTRLAHAYEAFKAAYKTKLTALPGDKSVWSPAKAEAGTDVLKALLPPFAMARSLDRLVSADPSLVTWIDSDLAAVLNSTFLSVARALARRGSSAQTQLFSPREQ